MRWKFDTLSLEMEGPHILQATLDRPERANAFNTQLADELRQLWTDLYQSSEDIRAVVLTGAGERAFCAGADLKERDGMSVDDWKRQHALIEQMVRGMLACPVPIIAAINGAAFAGGLELVLAADFAYAVPAARFAFTEVAIGLMPGAGGTQTLPRAVGVRRAKEIILAARPFDAEEALAWGVVNRLVGAPELMTTALDTARAIAGNAPLAVRQAKRALDVATQTDLGTGYEFEIGVYNQLIPTEDRLEGIRAFNEKRKPVFHGR